ncbi:hypothetical protein QAD02_011888, partial [Eretmocerus hayati]
LDIEMQEVCALLSKLEQENDEVKQYIQGVSVALSGSLSDPGASICNEEYCTRTIAQVSGPNVRAGWIEMQDLWEKLIQLESQLTRMSIKFGFTPAMRRRLLLERNYCLPGPSSMRIAEEQTLSYGMIIKIITEIKEMKKKYSEFYYEILVEMERLNQTTCQHSHH